MNLAAMKHILREFEQIIHSGVCHFEREHLLNKKEYCMNCAQWMYRLIVCLAIFAMTIPASAQQQRGQRGGQQGGGQGQRPVPVTTEGIVTAISAGSITVKTDDGASKTIELPENVRVGRNVVLSTSDLKAGATVSVQQRRGDASREVVLSVMPEGAGQQGGRRGGRGGSNMVTVKSTSPLTLESPDGEVREIPANAKVSVVRPERAEVADIAKSSKVQVREITSPRGKMVMITLIK
jgi:hypothetical protein